MYIYGMPCKASKGIYKGDVKMEFLTFHPPPPKKKKTSRGCAFLFGKKNPVSDARLEARSFVYGFRFKNNIQGIVGMYPYQRTPMGNPYIYISPRSTMGTLLGVHPIVP